MKMSFDDLNSPGDYRDYDILYGKKTIYKNDGFGIRTKKEMWIGGVLFIPYRKKRGQRTFENKMFRFKEIR